MTKFQKLRKEFDMLIGELRVNESCFNLARMIAIETDVRYLTNTQLNPMSGRIDRIIEYLKLEEVQTEAVPKVPAKTVLRKRRKR